VSAHLRRQAAGHLTHRSQQRQRAVGQLDGLVSDSGHLALDQLFGQRLVGGQVKVGEEGLPLTHLVVLGGHRFFDLQDQVTGGPHVGGGVQDLCPGRDVLVVSDRGTKAGIGLDVDLVAVAHELVHAGRRDGHPVLVVLDFLRDAYMHGSVPPIAVDIGVMGIGWGPERSQGRAETSTARDSSSSSRTLV